MLKAFLEHISGDYVGQMIEIDHTEAVIGRTKACNIVTEPKFTSVSQRHAIIRRTFDGWIIVDVGTYGKGSTYGTYLNDIRLEPNKEAALCPGDEIRLGTKLGKYFRFYGEGTIPVSQPASLRSRLKLDVGRRQLILDSRPLPLIFTPQEFQFLETLWRKPGTVCSFGDICALLWPSEKDLPNIVDNDLRVRINTLAHNLRRKLKPTLDGIDILESCRGVGYRLRL